MVAMMVSFLLSLSFGFLPKSFFGYIGIRGPPAEFLRTQCHSILSRLLRQLSSMSKSYLRNMVRATPLLELIDFFHAFVGFCIDPSSLLSPLSKYSFLSHIYYIYHRINNRNTSFFIIKI